MSRGTALLVAILGGGAAAAVATLFATMFLFGLLWMFVFGDDPWPAWVEPSLTIAAGVIALALWAALAWLIWVRLTSGR